MTFQRLLILSPIVLAACAVQDSHTARQAQSQLMGLSEVDLESCLGVPDQKASFGSTDVLTYYATSTSSDSFSIPVVGGIGFSNGAYCHATFQVKDDHVTRVLYSGEKNATMAPDAYCAPIVRTCLGYLANHPQTASIAPTGASSPAQPGPAARPAEINPPAMPAHFTPPASGTPAAAP